MLNRSSAHFDPALQRNKYWFWYICPTREIQFMDGRKRPEWRIYSKIGGDGRPDERRWVGWWWAGRERKFISDTREWRRFLRRICRHQLVFFSRSDGK
jgi:hypothetical protein